MASKVKHNLARNVVFTLAFDLEFSSKAPPAEFRKLVENWFRDTFLNSFQTLRNSFADKNPNQPPGYASQKFYLRQRTIQPQKRRLLERFTPTNVAGELSQKL